MCLDFFDGLFYLGERSLLSIDVGVLLALVALQRIQTLTIRNGSDCRVTYLSGIDVYTREIGLLIIVASPQLSLPRVSAFIALL